MKHVFIIGSKGIPANYGGYETFVHKLTEYQKNKHLKFHVACAVDDLSKHSIEFEFNGAHCFNIEWRRLGSARAIFYDVDALKWAIQYVKANKIEKPIFYILACRMGPFIHKYKKIISSLGGKLYVNPDGHEWLRSKWSFPVRKYWKISESLMIKHADLVICDSKNIEEYIHKEYKKYHPNTTYIAYGAETSPSTLSDDDNKWKEWLSKNQVKSNQYYLIVGRFVPENNYETMIREFCNSNISKDLVIITGVKSNDKFFDYLSQTTNFQKDKRVKFVGTVYDQDLLKKIREEAYGYLHGHEVGGTNPSLLEALGLTKLNLLFDVGFNREVALDTAYYWTKEKNNLARLLEKCENLSAAEINDISKSAKKVIREKYSCEYINERYERLFYDGEK